jgi:hypothetical protein
VKIRPRCKIIQMIATQNTKFSTLLADGAGTTD